MYLNIARLKNKDATMNSTACYTVAVMTMKLTSSKWSRNMEKNIGTKDKNIRLGAGAVLLLLSFFMKSWVLAVIGLVLIATALVGSCLAYQLLGIDTLGDKINQRKK